MVLGKEGLISTDDSPIKVYVIPTNEELVIARDTKDSGGKNVRNPVPSGVISKASGFYAGGFFWAPISGNL